MRASRLAALALMAASAVACTSDAPTQPTPIVFVGPADLVITDLRVGTGATLSLGQQATVHYGFWLYDPTKIDNKGTFIEDSRLAGPGNPFVTRLPAGQIIEGWRQGVPGMRVGGLRRLIIPPSLGYGSQGNLGVPPNAWLVFDIDLLSVAN